MAGVLFCPQCRPKAWWVATATHTFVEERLFHTRSWLVSLRMGTAILTSMHQLP